MGRLLGPLHSDTPWYRAARVSKRPRDHSLTVAARISHCFHSGKTKGFIQVKIALARREGFDCAQVWKRFVVRADRQNADVRSPSF